jgi:uncharacterized protein YqjF (DUF2071 family)
MMDRIRPTLRPDGWAVGLMKWRTLLFVHWPVPIEAIRPHVPARLSIDTFDGVAYVGVVPFLMLDVRVKGTPKRLGIDTLETNCRTYVHLDGRDPGVHFFSLDCESLLAVLGARTSVGLPYYYASMQMKKDGDEVDYRLKRRSPRAPSLSVRYRVGQPLGPSEPDSLQFWLLERYLLYVERAGGLLLCQQVHHAPYPARSAEVLEIRDELIAAAGMPQPQGLPPLAHWSEGVDVEVFRPRLRR